MVQTEKERHRNRQCRRCRALGERKRTKMETMEKTKEKKGCGQMGKESKYRVRRK